MPIVPKEPWLPEKPSSLREYRAGHVHKAEEREAFKFPAPPSVKIVGSVEDRADDIPSIPHNSGKSLVPLDDKGGIASQVIRATHCRLSSQVKDSYRSHEYVRDGDGVVRLRMKVNPLDGKTARPVYATPRPESPFKGKKAAPVVIVKRSKKVLDKG